MYRPVIMLVLSIGAAHATLTEQEDSVILASMVGKTELEYEKQNADNLVPLICQQTQLISLKLDQNGLESLPPQIKNLTKLEILSIIDNLLTSIPRNISFLSKLETLDLTRNKLTEWPMDIFKLTNLEVLKVASNNLSSIPNEIGQLINLKEFDASGNQISQLPESMANLTKLIQLSLINNKFKEWPKVITKVTSLGFLTLSGNQLTSVDDFPRMPHLVSIGFARNNIKRIPAWIYDKEWSPVLYYKNGDSVDFVGISFVDNPLVSYKVIKDEFWGAIDSKYYGPYKIKKVDKLPYSFVKIGSRKDLEISL